jgi:predicted nucleic acid-binding Zn ribbon protein
MSNHLDEPLRLRALLDPVGRRLGLGAPDSVGRLWAGWVDIVGPAMAGHAEPSSFRDGVLRVRTDSPTWATEIGYLSENIRTAANAWLGKEIVREVRVWTSPTKVRARGAPSAVQEARARVGWRGVRQPESDPKKAFERARRAWARRRGQGRDEGVS